MRKLVCTLLFALAPLSAQAGELRPGHAHSIDLNGVTGVAYYTVEAGAYRIAAVLSSGEAAVPVRFAASLAPDQSITVSVPGALGGSDTTIEFTRHGDMVHVGPALVALN
jgi:hypothetical protein